jgi:hypothetical protein
MSTIYTNVLSNEELDYFKNHPNVQEAKASIDAKNSGKIYFSVPITNVICTTLNSRLGLNLSVGTQIPMRWIKGDTAPHVDVGASHFQNTYLMYLNDSLGEFIVNSQSYPIEANTGFVFNEGLSHETQNTDNSPRLLLGPMNELAEPVGASALILYYTNYNDAYSQNVNNIASQSTTFILGDTQNITYGSIGSYTSWRVAYISGAPTPPPPPVGVYSNGFDLSTLNLNGYDYYSFFVYPSAPCFLEGTTILCQIDGVEKYIPVEQLKKDTLVKTSLDGYKPVVLVGKGNIQNPDNDERIENRLYKCSTDKYPQLINDLYITGCHSILEFPITEKQKEDTIKHLGRLFVTDKKYRLMACLDERAEPWNSKGDFTIWHFALENADEKMNYGVYANGGLLVETCSIIFLKNKSNMKLSFTKT